METIIGLGGAGCAIAKQFQEYPQYQVYLIDTEKHDHHKYLHIPEQKTHQEYEQACPPSDEFFDDVGGSCLFVMSGAGKLSGASLRLLYSLRAHNVSILYVHPDADDLQGEVLMRHNLNFGVLQQYARSGLFNKMYLVQNSKLEEILDDLPVIGYFKKINDYMVSTIHMINVFANTSSEFDTFRDCDESARIVTFGIVDPETVEEKLFFDLKMPREKRYYYGINRTELETDGSLLKKVKENIRNKLDGLTKVYYGIFSTNYESSYGYCCFSSSLIQTEVGEG